MHGANKDNLDTTPHNNFLQQRSAAFKKQMLIAKWRGDGGGA
jgi:hypothetical protein